MGVCPLLRIGTRSRLPPHTRTLARIQHSTTMICSLEKTHATKREASAMLAEIVQKITETEWMAATVHRVHLDPHELYEVVKVRNRWHIKATAQHLKAAKALRPKGYGV